MERIRGTLACWGLSIFFRFQAYICRLPRSIWVPLYYWLCEHDRCGWNDDVLPAIIVEAERDGTISLDELKRRLDTALTGPPQGGNR